MRTFQTVRTNGPVELHGFSKTVSVMHTFWLLLGVSSAVAIGNLAAAIGIGLGEGSWAMRLRVAVVFTVFEGSMPVVGMVLGRHLARAIGSATRYPAAALLLIIGAYGLWKRSEGSGASAGAGLGLFRLVLLGLALSMDNLAAGFALGTSRVGVVIAALTFGTVSAVMTVTGLMLGTRLGYRGADRSEDMSGVTLILLGIAIAAGLIR